ncbi:hypothetical protein SOVF_121810 [Spinacia oleracea]|nr:hypothetical protein SOVF_121810 [Spinacia oleracea]
MESENCSNELVSFSPCLPYTASPPSNFSSNASNDCCSNYNNILISGRGHCLCYLLLQPPILGAPLNDLKIFSLSSVCPLPRQSNFNSLIDFSLELFCSDLEASPPFQSAGPESGVDPSSTEQFSGSPTPLSPSAEMDLTPIAADILHPPLPGLLLDSYQASSATRISFSTPLSLILSSLHKTLIRWRQWSSCFLEFFSLSSVCPPRQSNFDSLINFSLELFCSGSPTPLLPSAEMDLTPIAADILHPAPPGLLLDSSQASSATRISLSTPLSLILSRLGADGAC